MLTPRTRITFSSKAEVSVERTEIVVFPQTEENLRWQKEMQMIQDRHHEEVLAALQVSMKYLGNESGITKANYETARKVWLSWPVKKP